MGHTLVGKIETLGGLSHQNRKYNLVRSKHKYKKMRLLGLEVLKSEILKRTRIPGRDKRTACLMCIPALDPSI